MRCTAIVFTRNVGQQFQPLNLRNSSTAGVGWPDKKDVPKDEPGLRTMMAVLTVNGTKP